jgi:CDP-glucose 4,6-dehydratase
VARSLVTGGQGFIGGHLCRALLERGDDVVVLDLPGAPGMALEIHGIRSEVELVEGDVAERAVVNRAVRGSDSVFHLAAQTLVGPAAEDPEGTFRSNVAGTWTLLEACRENDVASVVVASSDKAYGPSDSLPYTESDELCPAAPYEASKAATDLIARSYWASWGLPASVTRLANVYGGGDLNFSRLIPEVVTAYLADRRPRIRSDGSPQRDFLHVSDAVAAYLAIESALERGDARGEALNAGTGRPRSVREVIDRVQASTGSGQQPDYLLDRNPDGEIDRQFVDATKLTDLTGWQPRMSFEDGIDEAVAWYRAEGDFGQAGVELPSPRR